MYEAERAARSMLRRRGFDHLRDAVGRLPRRLPFALYAHDGERSSHNDPLMAKIALRVWGEIVKIDEGHGEDTVVVRPYRDDYGVPREEMEQMRERLNELTRGDTTCGQ